MTYVNTYPLFRAWDHNNDPLSGGKVYSYVVGTSTKTNTYSDFACTIPNANPVILDSLGEASIYISGSVKLVVKDADDVLLFTVNEAAGGILWTFSPASASVLYSSVVYGGTQGALVNAIAAVGASDATLYLTPSTWLITSNLSIPANITIKPERGAVLAVSNAVTLTGTFDAGPYQIFSLSGTGQTVVTGEVKPEWWYSGSGNYNAAITAAMKSNRKVVFQAGKNYPYLGLISIPATTNLTVSAYGATLTNGTVTSQSIQFTSAVNFNWLGGSHRFIGATTNQSGAEHVLYFINGAKISVQDLDILGSPEMGIAYNNCVNVTTKNCIISGTHRDGIHHIYCANALVEGNKLSQISDDAIAFHDYGLDAGKAVLIAAGYPQAYGAVIKGNIIEYAYQGIDSIGGDSVDIAHNTIKETVNAGIVVVGSAALSVGGTVVPLNFNIGPNILRHNGGTQTINGVSHANSGQSSTGRAAIVVCSLDAGSIIGGTKYPHDGAIHHNQIIESYVSGIYKDGLRINVSGNYIYNGNIDEHVDTGTMIASYGTAGLLSNNTVLDDRTPKKHAVGYYSATTGGYEIGNLVDGVTNENRYSTSTTPIIYGADGGGNLIYQTPGRKTITYGATVTPNLTDAQYFVIDLDVNAALTIANPVTLGPLATNAHVFFELYKGANTGTITWGTTWHATTTSLSANKKAIWEFIYNGTYFTQANTPIETTP